MRNLEYLNLQNTKLKYFDFTSIKHTKVQTLNLHGCRIYMVNYTACLLNLHTLYMSDVKLALVSQESFPLKHLQHLTFINSSIVKINISNSNLESLKLINCTFEHVTILDLPYLKTLILKGSYLRNFDIDGELKQLQYLDFSNLNMIHMRMKIIKFTHLNSLLLNNFPFHQLDLRTGFENVEYLSLKNNNLSRFESTWLGMPGLKCLDLSQNSIKFIDIKDLHELEYLIVDDNNGPAAFKMPQESKRILDIEGMDCCESPLHVKGRNLSETEAVYCMKSQNFNDSKNICDRKHVENFTANIAKFDKPYISASVSNAANKSMVRTLHGSNKDGM